MKPMKLEITRCPTCVSDQIEQVCRDWTGTYHGQAYVVPALTFYECPICGEQVFEREALAKIEAYCLRSPNVRRRRTVPRQRRERDTSRSATDLTFRGNH